MWLDFIEHLILGLSWPVVIVAILLVFKPQLRTLIEVLILKLTTVRSASGKGFAVEFEVVPDLSQARQQSGPVIHIEKQP